MTMSEENLQQAAIEHLEQRIDLYLHRCLYDTSGGGGWAELIRAEMAEFMAENRGMWPGLENRRIKRLRDALDAVWGLAINRATTEGCAVAIRILEKALRPEYTNGTHG